MSIMNLHDVNKLTKKWIVHLTGKNDFTLDELLEMSKRNRRVRNVSLFYIYSHEQYKERFENLMLHDKVLNNFRFNFSKALTRLENEEVNGNVKELALVFKKKYFSHMNPLITNEYDVSEEMAKFFKTAINNYSLNDSHGKKKHREKLLKNFDLDKMIV